jgi:hypothetical protein
MKETLLWGCKIDSPNYMEEILYKCKGYVNKDELIKKGEEWAKQNGYDRLRIAEIDLSIAPNFKQSINI